MLRDIIIYCPHWKHSPMGAMSLSRWPKSPFEDALLRLLAADRGSAAPARYVHNIRRSSVARSLKLTGELRLDDRKFDAFCRSTGYPTPHTSSASSRDGFRLSQPTEWRMYLSDRRPSGECRSKCRLDLVRFGLEFRGREVKREHRRIALDLFPSLDGEVQDSNRAGRIFLGKAVQFRLGA